jgi:hypothetical protein
MTSWREDTDEVGNPQEFLPKNLTLGCAPGTSACRSPEENPMPLARLLRAASPETDATAVTAQDAAPLPAPPVIAGAADPGDGLLASLFDWSFRDELDTDWGRARLTAS